MAKQVRVQISKNTEKLLNLAELVAKKHLELGKDSKKSMEYCPQR